MPALSPAAAMATAACSAPNAVPGCASRQAGTSLRMSSTGIVPSHSPASHERQSSDAESTSARAPGHRRRGELAGIPALQR